MKSGTRAMAGVLLVTAAILGGRECSPRSEDFPETSRSNPHAAGKPRLHGQHAPSPTGAPRRERKTSGRVAGPDAVARYLRSDDEGRHRILEEWTDRAGNGTSPDDVVARLAELYPRETDPELKEAIIDALAWAGTGDAFDALLGIHREAAVDSEEGDLAAAALESVISDLADAAGPADWDRIAQAWQKDLPRDVRLAAIQGVMEGDQRSMIPQLRALAKDGDPEVREAAGQAIEWLEDHP